MYKLSVQIMHLYSFVEQPKQLCLLIFWLWVLAQITSYDFFLNCADTYWVAEKCTFSKHVLVYNKPFESPVHLLQRSTKNHLGKPVCLYVCMSLLAFFAIYSKNLQETHTSKFVILCIAIFFCGCPYEEKNLKKI